MDSQWADGDGWHAYPLGDDGEWTCYAELRIDGKSGPDVLRSMAARLRKVADEMEQEASK